MLPFGVLDTLQNGLRATRRQHLLYMAVYLVFGLCMNSLGKLLQIAEFVHWWQVLTCYLLYLVPVSLLLRGRPWPEQYAFGVLALAPLELSGFALGTSRAFEGNVVDRILGPRNFVLAMTVLFGAIVPLGNAAIARLEALLFPIEISPATASARADSEAA